MSNDPNIGALFGLRWRIERPLGAGGMGSVYVARHENTGRRVALKVIKGEGTASAELAARFVRETQALAALSHPNVVTFLDSGCEGATCFLVMELLQGRSLRTLMGRPVEWRRDFRIGADILRRLGFSSVRLLTNNPRKLAMMESCGLQVVERVPLHVGQTAQNRDYLATKAAKSGHMP